MEQIDEIIEQSWYKYNPRLVATCQIVIKEINKHTIKGSSGFNRCWLFMQLLHGVQQKIKIGLPYYWYRDGVVVDPETLMMLTRGKIIFKWEPDCKGCQIEKECPCMGNPNNNTYASIEERLKVMLA